LLSPRYKYHENNPLLLFLAKMTFKCI